MDPEDRNAYGGKLLAYFGHHKCGSQWVRAFVSKVCSLCKISFQTHSYDYHFNGDIRLITENPTIKFWNYINADYVYVRYLNCLGFHVIRDPRDMIVSGYYSHLYSHPTEDWGRLAAFRRYLMSIDKEKGILEEMEFQRIFLSHMFSWDYSDQRIMNKKLEALSENPRIHFEEIARHLRLYPGYLMQTDLDRITDEMHFLSTPE